MQMPCPQCKQWLSLPDHAVGHWVRCRGCEHKFVVPHPEHMLEDTISGWILEDVHDIEQLRQEHERVR